MLGVAPLVYGSPPAGAGRLSLGRNVAQPVAGTHRMSSIKKRFILEALVGKSMLIARNMSCA